MPKPRVFTGIDPGLVCTGLVRLVLPPDETSERWWKVEHEAINGLDIPAISAWVDQRPGHPVFVEDYRARQSYNSDPEMIRGVDRIKMSVPNVTLINNSGSKKVIRPALLKLMSLYKFPTTHHQDLQAAARILIWGMLKNENYNELLATFVDDHISGHPWTNYIN